MKRPMGYVADQATLEESDAALERRRKHRTKRKRRSRKQEKLFRNLLWFAGGLAFGLPLLAGLLYVMSR